jgi:surface carbohydrate biosynthesis protein (TIGR04326 family)
MVDAYCAGVPVVSVLDPTMLNMSPLRGYAGTFYAGTPDELIRALQEIRSDQFTVPTRSSFFILNRALPLWRKLLVGAG